LRNEIWTTIDDLAAAINIMDDSNGVTWCLQKENLPFLAQNHYKSGYFRALML